MKTKKIISYVALLLGGIFIFLFGCTLAGPGGIFIFLFGCTLAGPGPAVPWYDYFTGGNQLDITGILSGIFLMVLGTVLIVCSIEGLEELV